MRDYIAEQIKEEEEKPVGSREEVIIKTVLDTSEMP